MKMKKKLLGKSLPHGSWNCLKIGQDFGAEKSFSWHFYGAEFSKKIFFS
jgi:hypothetical protein